MMYLEEVRYASMMVRLAFVPPPHVPTLNSVGGVLLGIAFCLTRVCCFLHSHLISIGGIGTFGYTIVSNSLIEFAAACLMFELVRVIIALTSEFFWWLLVVFAEALRGVCMLSKKTS
jgi:hypothetical protein